MTLVRFLAIGLRDAEARLARLTAPAGAQDAGLWDVLDDSRPGRAASRLSRAIKRSAAHSRAAGRSRTMAQGWVSLTPLARMRAVGVVVIAAAATHITLAWPYRTPGGWWLILPLTALVFGMAALTLSWTRLPGSQDPR